MAQIVARVADELADASPEDILCWAIETFRDRICVTSSMTDAVIVHIASAIRPGIDVVFLDTGYHFAETIGTRDAVSAVYPVNLINVTPSRTVDEQDAELGPRLYRRNPDLCCYLRKVEPLERALAATTRGSPACGARRPWSAGRRPSVDWDEKREMVKVNPIVSWARQAGRRLHRDERRAGEPAGVRRVPVDRLPHLHAAGGVGRRPAQRPVGGHGQDRMRHPPLRLSSPGGRCGDRSQLHNDKPWTRTVSDR